MNEYTESGCLDIIEAAYKKCLTKPIDAEEIRYRKYFLKDGPMFDLWCDIEDHDKDRLVNFAIMRMNYLTRK